MSQPVHSAFGFLNSLPVLVATGLFCVSASAWGQDDPIPPRFVCDSSYVSLPFSENQGEPGGKIGEVKMVILPNGDIQLLGGEGGCVDPDRLDDGSGPLIDRLTVLSWPNLPSNPTVDVPFTIGSPALEGIVLPGGPVGVTARYVLKDKHGSSYLASGSSWLNFKYPLESQTFTIADAGAYTVSLEARRGSVPFTVDGVAANITVNSAAPGQPELVVESGSAAFGSVSINPALPPTRTITIRNDGDAAASNLNFTTPNAPFSRTGGTCTVGGSLAVGSTCTHTYQFNPTTTGPFPNQTVTVTPSTPPLEITLSGTGAAAGQPALVVASGTGVFGPVSINPATPPTRTITIRNDGDAAASNLGFTTPGTPFSLLTSSSCPAGGSLVVGSTCTLIYQFNPTGAGAFSETVTVTPSSSLLQIPLSGTGTGTAGDPPPAHWLINTDQTYEQWNDGIKFAAGGLGIMNKHVQTRLLDPPHANGSNREPTVYSYSFTVGAKDTPGEQNHGWMVGITDYGGGTQFFFISQDHPADLATLRSAPGASTFDSRCMAFNVNSLGWMKSDLPGNNIPGDHPSVVRCKLDPGRTYYFNLLNVYLQGVIENTGGHHTCIRPPENPPSWLCRLRVRHDAGIQFAPDAPASEGGEE